MYGSIATIHFSTASNHVRPASCWIVIGYAPCASTVTASASITPTPHRFKIIVHREPALTAHGFFPSAFSAPFTNTCADNGPPKIQVVSDKRYARSFFTNSRLFQSASTLELANTLSLSCTM